MHYLLLIITLSIMGITKILLPYLNKTNKIKQEEFFMDLTIVLLIINIFVIFKILS